MCGHVPCLPSPSLMAPITGMDSAPSRLNRNGNVRELAGAHGTGFDGVAETGAAGCGELGEPQSHGRFGFKA